MNTHQFLQQLRLLVDQQRVQPAIQLIHEQIASFPEARQYTWGNVSWRNVMNNHWHLRMQDRLVMVFDYDFPTTKSYFVSKEDREEIRAERKLTLRRHAKMRQDYKRFGMKAVRKALEQGQQMPLLFSDGRMEVGVHYRGNDWRFPLSWWQPKKFLQFLEKKEVLGTANKWVEVNCFDSILKYAQLSLYVDIVNAQGQDKKALLRSALDWGFSNRWSSNQ